MKLIIRIASFLLFTLFFINFYAFASDINIAEKKNYFSYIKYSCYSLLTVGMGVLIYKSLNGDTLDENNEIPQKPRRDGVGVQFDPQCMEMLDKTRELSDLLDEIGGNFLSNTFKKYKYRFINSKNFTLDDLIEKINIEVNEYGTRRIKEKARILCESLLNNRDRIENLKLQINNL